MAQFKKGDHVGYKLGREGHGEVEGSNGSLVVIRTWENTDDPEGEIITVGARSVWHF